jgi:hypothetical protein
MSACGSVDLLSRYCDSTISSRSWKRGSDFEKKLFSIKKIGEKYGGFVSNHSHSIQKDSLTYYFFVERTKIF